MRCLEKMLYKKRKKNKCQDRRREERENLPSVGQQMAFKMLVKEGHN